MERAKRQGIAINLQLELAVLGDYASLTTFDNTSIGGGAGVITVSAANIDDVVRNIKKTIYANNGGNDYAQFGGFIIWDPKIGRAHV